VKVPAAPNTLAPAPVRPLRLLLVDDEELARLRLRSLVASCAGVPARIVAEAAHAAQAMECLQAEHVDAVLLDIRMPGLHGLALADVLRAHQPATAVVFVTAHADHALRAFELDAVDYLTKPVRRERLQAALEKVQRLVGQRPAEWVAQTPGLLVQVRGHSERVPLEEVLYLKAELKYVTLQTVVRSHILDLSLLEIEQQHPGHFVRIHRNALVARRALRALERVEDAPEGDNWQVRLQGWPEPLAVSRRQLATVRALLKG
jgi:two-component system, LytTR family, response regulator AlgR